MINILLITLLFSMNTQAIDLILGGLSHHIGQKRYPDRGRRVRYNSNHKMRGIGFKYGDYYLSMINFNNSFYMDSVAASIGYKVGGLYIGATLATEYDKAGISNIGDLLLMPSLKYDYGYFTILTMGNAVIGSFTIPIDG